MVEKGGESMGKQPYIDALDYPYMCSCCGRTFDRRGLFVGDVGIGSYEAWGSRGQDICLAVMSLCCETMVLTNDDDRRVILLDDL